MSDYGIGLGTGGSFQDKLTTIPTLRHFVVKYLNPTGTDEQEWGLTTNVTAHLMNPTENGMVSFYTYVKYADNDIRIHLTRVLYNVYDIEEVFIGVEKFNQIAH